MKNAEQNSVQNSSPDTASITSEVFGQFKTYLDQKIESLAAGLNVASESQTRKLERQTEGRSLKFPGNRDQFLFNNDVQDLLYSTAGSLRNEDTASALKSIEQADTLLRQRQKKIKLADKSEAGWLAVKEYEADDLASDSDDEKRIRKAQDSALRKRRQNASKKDTARQQTTPYCSNSRVANDQLFFRGNLFPFFVLSYGRQVLARRLPSTLCVYMCLVGRRRKMSFLRMNEVKQKEMEFSFG